MSKQEGVTITWRDGHPVAEPIDGEPLSETTQRAVAHLLRERTPEEKALSSRLYNETCERLWGKLLAHEGELTKPDVPGWDAFTSANPIAQSLAYEVDAEFNYEMSYMQCSWSSGMFCRYSPAQYETETGVRIEAHR